MYNVEDATLTGGGIQDKRKLYGQFFTGPKLSRLLVALADPNPTSSVIDPMVGTGDMLRAAREFNSQLDLSGIEIDDGVFRRARAQIGSYPNLTLVNGNAFDLDTLRRVKNTNFDLVITNPPYVRYQTLSGNNHDVYALKTSKIRRALLDLTEYLVADTEDRRLLSEIIRSYSGLSDLAVPSWILAAMLTKVGGTLALVVPESWLSREYAQIIQYILFRWFRVRYIVEDSNAVWFPDALVKTTLLVAERVIRRPSAFSWRDETYAHISVSADATSKSSIVGNIFPDDMFPEKAFASELKSLLARGKAKDGELWSANPVLISERADYLMNAVKGEPWFRTCEPTRVADRSSAILPVELRRWADDSEEHELTTLEHVGVGVGQGLRTGANVFFYLDIIEDRGEYVVVAPHKSLECESLSVPAASVRTVLRRQSELPPGYEVKADTLKGRVLCLREQRLSGELGRFVAAARNARVGGKLISELSAVRTNVRTKSANNNRSSDWYMLPDFAPRHMPDLLIPRVNAQTPRAFLNDPGVIVDANFSTLWLWPDSSFTAWSLLALLNSIWAKANMELTGSVMGGGALKLEASHVKRIPFPMLDVAQLDKLDRLGRQLAKSGEPGILNLIDEIVVGALFKKSHIRSKVVQLRVVVDKRLAERSKRK